MKHPPIGIEKRSKARPLPNDYINDLRAEFSELELTEAQANDILTTLYDIMARYVRMGFGLEPVGKLISDFENSSTSSSILVNSKDANDE